MGCQSSSNCENQLRHHSGRLRRCCKDRVYRAAVSATKPHPSAIKDTTDGSGEYVVHWIANKYAVGQF